MLKFYLEYWPERSKKNSVNNVFFSFVNESFLKTEHSPNKTVSSVILKATRKIHGQTLSCTAVNVLFPEKRFMDALLLNITCEYFLSNA